MEYNFLADMLNKFHTSEPWIQAVTIIVLGTMFIGLCYFLKEMVVALVSPFRERRKRPDKEELAES